MENRSSRKQKVTKRIEQRRIWEDDQWVVNTGRLVQPPGRPRKTKTLFRHGAEKIPYEALNTVRKEFHDQGWETEGVNIAHDSMGFARYVGRGMVFSRLRARLRNAPLELKYFSFYIVANKSYEREIETLMIRLGGAHLHFNERKKRVDIQPGNIHDYEEGKRFIERKRRRGRA